MNKFNVGDKVKFLNQKGGGRVTRILSDKVVGVEEENGFEIPTMISELLLVDTQDKIGKMFVNQPEIPIAEPPDTIIETSKDDTDTDIPLPNTMIKEIDGIFIAFVPVNQRWLITGDIQIWLINNTKDTLLYNILAKQQIGDTNLEGFDFGSMETRTKRLLTTIHREDLSLWAENVIQLLFHNTAKSQVIEPQSFFIPIKEENCEKEIAFTKNNFFEERAIITSVFIKNKI
jgi:hypothetical protein